MSEFEMLLHALVPLILLGLTIGIVFAVVVSFARLAFKLAPIVVIGAFLLYFLY